VDDGEVFQFLPFDEVAWHVGDRPNGPRNRKSIAIETCVNGGGNLERMLRNPSALLAALCRAYAWGKDRIVQHNHWSGKNCPNRIRAENG
jgi:N-acetylmuramoyl-L-alanine amidase